jgi:type IV secretory pathway TraG/TraD family ATPase VirD4
MIGWVVAGAAAAWHVALAIATPGLALSNVAGTFRALVHGTPLTIEGAGPVNVPLLVVVLVTIAAAVIAIWVRVGRSQRASQTGLGSGASINRFVRKVGHDRTAVFAYDGRVGIRARVEDTTIVFAPPRQGKSNRFVIPSVVDADGPVVVTSTKVDVLRATQLMRRERGEVFVFDPNGISSWPDACGWDVVRGCEDPEVAVARASAMVAANPIGDARNAAVFEKTATIVLRCLLHAAALKAGGSARDVVRWAARFDDEEPFTLLRQSKDAPYWHLDLSQQTRSASPETVASTGITLGVILEPLKLERVLAAAAPPAGTGFDTNTFLDGDNTLYLLCEGGGSSSAAPLITALAADVERVVRRRAQRTAKGRLKRPVAFILDEAANIAPLPTLPQMMTTGGSQGLMVRVIVQSFSQLVDRWGESGGRTIFNAAGVKLIFGGSEEAEFLETVASLAGTRNVTRVSHQSQGSGSGGSTSVSVDKEPIVTASEIAQLPEGRAFLRYRGMRPVFVTVKGFWQRKDAKRFSESTRDSLSREGLTDD